MAEHRHRPATGEAATRAVRIAALDGWQTVVVLATPDGLECLRLEPVAVDQV